MYIFFKATAAPVDSQGDSTEGTGSARKRTARTSVKKESESETVSGVGGAPVPGISLQHSAL